MALARARKWPSLKTLVTALSRRSGTPPQLLPELNPEGTDYCALADDFEDAFQASWPVLAMVFEDASQKLTHDDIVAEWPTDCGEKPDKPCRACGAGLRAASVLWWVLAPAPRPTWLSKGF